eukprot:CAMPEP_0194415118 /NCGR_PEP_ID=MMETSP0176-20130528/13862_1 /TAXON_ID=216777 /ORGANISM="Proboscia alata, Strain PI-D3" /LENGTH=516 /DNA_ID=CAMNT_0039219559 /DNA_START=115 /DNA_END=1665 /DNA_ORIENTATION=+
MSNYRKSRFCASIITVVVFGGVPLTQCFSRNYSGISSSRVSVIRTDQLASPRQQTSMFMVATEHVTNGEIAQESSSNKPITSVTSAPSKKSVSRYENKMAILLNLNAKCVTPAVIQTAREMIGSEHVFVTRTEEESHVVTRRIVELGYGLVVPTGGDGTLCSVINSVVAARDALQSRDGSGGGDDGAGMPLPKFAFLPLGTGNGMGSLVGPQIRGRRRTQKTLTLLTQLLSQQQRTATALPTIRVPMMELSAPNPEVNRKLCFFAGAGFDSLMLNDFRALKGWSVRRNVLKGLLGGVAGYCVALLVRTLPRCLLRGHQRLTCRITVPKPTAGGNDDNDDIPETYWIDPRRGDMATPVTSSQAPPPRDRASAFPQPIQPDHNLLFEGTTGIIAAGTSPYYGGGLRLFPFARIFPAHSTSSSTKRLQKNRNTLHLRLGRIHPLTGLVNLFQIFRGTYRERNMKVLDFVGNDFHVELSDPYPFQFSGEAVERPLSSFRFKAFDEAVEFVDFIEPRLVHG